MVGEGKQVSFDDLYNTSSLAALQNEAEKRESFQKRFESKTAGVIHLSKFFKESILFFFLFPTIYRDFDWFAEILDNKNALFDLNLTKEGLIVTNSIVDSDWHTSWGNLIFITKYNQLAHSVAAVVVP